MRGSVTMVVTQYEQQQNTSASPVLQEYETRTTLLIGCIHMRTTGTMDTSVISVMVQLLIIVTGKLLQTNFSSRKEHFFSSQNWSHYSCMKLIRDCYLGKVKANAMVT